MRTKNGCVRGVPVDEEYEREKQEAYDRHIERKHDFYREVNV